MPATNKPYVKQYDKDGNLIEPERNTVTYKNGKITVYFYGNQGLNRKQRNK